MIQRSPRRGLRAACLVVFLIVFGVQPANAALPLVLGRSEGEHVVWGDTTFTEPTVAWGNLATSKAKPANTLGGAILSP